MTEIVKIQEEKAVTTSLKVAEVFGKRHADVLRAIENMECPQEFKERNFAFMLKIRNLANGGKRKEPYYEITRQGFTLLAMGFTGKKAMQFKVAYIEAFDAMEEQIRKMQKNPLTRNETALVFQMINFFKYLEHCRKIEEEHKRDYVSQRITNNTSYSFWSKEFHRMRNNLLGIGNSKSIKEKYKEYYIKNPKYEYDPKRNKFAMIFTMDKYEPLRHAIADFLKLELKPDGYTLQMASEAKDLAKRGKVKIEKNNETNLLQEKEEDLIDFKSLKKLANKLLQIP